MKKIVLGFFLLSFVGCSGWKSDLSSNGNGQFEDRKLQDLESLSANSVRILEKPTVLTVDEGQPVEFTVRVRYFGGGEIEDSQLSSEELLKSFPDFKVDRLDSETFKASFSIPFDYINSTNSSRERDFNYDWNLSVRLASASSPVNLKTVGNLKLIIQPSKQLWKFERILFNKDSSRVYYERNPGTFQIWMKPPTKLGIAVSPPILSVEDMTSVGVSTLKIPIATLIKPIGDPQLVVGYQDTYRFNFEVSSPYDALSIEKVALNFNIRQQLRSDPSVSGIAFSTDWIKSDPIILLNAFGTPETTLASNIDLLRDKDQSITFSVFDPRQEGLLKVEFFAPMCNRPDSGVTCTCSSMAYTADCVIAVKANSIKEDRLQIDYYSYQYFSNNPSNRREVRFSTKIRMQ